MERKPELLQVLRVLLSDVFTAQTTGASGQKLVRAFGYADGYMRALIEAGIVPRDELLELVAQERRRIAA
jgi:hypothetical protein